ncbi:1-deoxy-D-xylulose-5-phosphate reductoisomerase [Limnohabitans sp. MMS-10A-160]|jgi:1-deoxy-D-xylulose-5-phosphate reductoisomerase|uniref:1-deoxy-D-xylulose-5-phosphate reductoisomerase n=1 Tax=unclassified Limnohabitans TaxID=2626134 RepID=UPI000D37C803|nr:MULTISPECIES: 1-deoxy-D-xylulose-5-phosphate reductoisomerase [unclassified Limnohabitans]PUE22033.1 1-deoxy-D-xylulose-5-phosphate reductoisomerase [Limnohabitans sp. MMS-10A-192]PUE25684.1 1-deoxy-D-xylulose-5-phosphate reductoisomerase [Limnohabitans sp. MMS-10A-160]
MNKKQSITILGSTGSIGTSTLDVLARHPEQFSVYALTASSQVDLMLAQCAQFKPQIAVMVREDAGRLLADRVKAEGLPVEVRWGAQALDEVSCAPEVDAVMAAIVGAAGLSPCLAAARAGKRLLLANKEALVVGGEVFLSAVREGGATLLPIDSEHSAIFQSLPEDPTTWQRRVHKIILTASGGPFRGRDPSTLKDVTPEQACAHPNWVMGRKISVDSATMMNKALEVIEARYLFGMSPDQLEVVIHPQSVIHSMVQYKDNSVVAQLGTPDMRVPIAYGLSWPERMTSGASALDFHALAAMTFEAMDGHGHPQRFPGIQLAWETLNGAPGSCALLNAANEIAVEAFLNRQIRFDQIHVVNRATLDELSCPAPKDLQDLMTLDRQGREMARSIVLRLAA